METPGSGRGADPHFLDASASTPVQKACLIGVLSAMSTALMALSFPTPFAPYLKYDPGDVAAVFAGLSIGPAAGVLTVVIRSIASMVTFHPDPFGVTMNGLAGASFVLAVSLVYHRRRTGPGLITAFFVGSVTMVLSMLVVNIVVLPYFFHDSLENLIPILLGTVTPFNIVKATLNALIGYGLVSRLIATAPQGKAIQGL